MAKKNIILIGFMGAGKSVVGQSLAKRLGFDFLDTDSFIEQAAGMPVSKIFADFGEAKFRKMETRTIREISETRDRTVVSAGGGLPVCEENRLMLKRMGQVVFLQVSPETVLERLKDDQSRPLLAGGDAGEKAASLMAVRNPIYLEAADLVIQADKGSVESIVTEICKNL